MLSSRTLGTELRHLLELLDTDVQQAYAVAGLDYRPRYTPIMRVLLASGPSSIRSIATGAGLSHSAISQTVAQMAKAGLVAFAGGRDERERIVTPTAKLGDMVPAIERCWAATNAAAAALDRELPYPLSSLVAEAVALLQTTSFGDRIAAHADAGDPERC